MFGHAAALQALDNQGAVDFWYASGFISRDTYDGLLKYCNFSATGEAGWLCAALRWAEDWMGKQAVLLV